MTEVQLFNSLTTVLILIGGLSFVVHQWREIKRDNAERKRVVSILEKAND